jgi:hypothetical protein
MATREQIAEQHSDIGDDEFHTDFDHFVFDGEAENFAAINSVATTVPIDDCFSSHADTGAQEALLASSSSTKPVFTDSEIIDFPKKLHEVFNSGDLDKLNKLVDDYFTDDFVLRTPYMARELVGRRHFKELFSSILIDRPDTIHVLRYVKLVADRGSREHYLATRVGFQGTRCFGSGGMEKPNELLDPELLTELVTERDIERALHIFEAREVSYKIVGETGFRYNLTEENHIIECIVNHQIKSVRAIQLSDHERGKQAPSADSRRRK